MPDYMDLVGLQALTKALELWPGGLVLSQGRLIGGGLAKLWACARRELEDDRRTWTY